MTAKKQKIKLERVLGRPRKFSNAEELEKQCYYYFKECQKECKIPTKPGLLVFLGISNKTYYNYINDKDNPEFSDIFERCNMLMEDYDLQCTDGPNSSGAQFRLKNYHGCNAEETKNIKLGISLEDFLKDVEEKDGY